LPPGTVLLMKMLAKLGSKTEVSNLIRVHLLTSCLVKIHVGVKWNGSPCRAVDRALDF